MSGDAVPYYLRPNKAVDRLLFVEALRMLDRWRSISKYAYISMGGRGLEDFKLIHSEFALRNLHSLEINSLVVERQEFNKPYSFISCHCLSAESLAADYETFADAAKIKNVVVWLDYAAASERQAQLREYGALIRKLRDGDIIRITMNAAPHTLAPNIPRGRGFEEAAFSELQKQLGEYFDANRFDATSMNAEGVAQIVASAIGYSAIEAAAHLTGIHVHPVSLFRYADGNHQMLTVTAVVLDKKNTSKMLKRTKLQSWDYAAKDWSDVRIIRMPDLSAKERSFIDRLITKPTNDIHDELPFRFDDSAERSRAILQQYLDHYRRYPNFVRTVA